MSEMCRSDKISRQFVVGILVVLSSAFMSFLLPRLVTTHVPRWKASGPRCHAALVNLCRSLLVDCAVLEDQSMPRGRPNRRGKAKTGDEQHVQRTDSPSNTAVSGSHHESPEDSPREHNPKYSEKHVSVKVDTPPKHTYVERIRTPLRQHSGDFEEAHAHIDSDVASPHSGYVEKVTTPRRPPSLDEPLEDQKHAHLDEVMSPHGYVQRKLTPVSKNSSQAFPPEDDASPEEGQGAWPKYLILGLGVAIFAIALVRR
jgi:hypothetical protein